MTDRLVEIIKTHYVWTDDETIGPQSYTNDVYYRIADAIREQYILVYSPKPGTTMMFGNGGFVAYYMSLLKHRMIEEVSENRNA